MSRNTSLAPPSTPAGTTPRRATAAGWLLVGAGGLSAIGAGWLSGALGWPDLLDAPGSRALPQFTAHELAYRAAFYLMLASSLLLIPAAIYLEDLAGERGRPGPRSITTLGVAGALAQLLGWVRWPVTVPHLADDYAAADALTRPGIASSYDALNRYAGAALGEHLGWLLQGLWAIGIAVLMLRVTGIPRWFSTVGAALALVWLPLQVTAGLVEISWVNTAGVTAYSAWLTWILLLGLLLLARRTGQPRAAERG